MKRSFLSEKEEATSRNTNYERKKNIGPDKYVVKVVNQPCKNFEKNKEAKLSKRCTKQKHIKYDSKNSNVGGRRVKIQSC